MLCPPPHPSTELVQLRQAEAFRLLHNHQRSVRNIDADLDHRCRDENGKFAFLEALHNGILFGPLHSPMNKADPVSETMPKRFGASLRRSAVAGLAFLDKRAHPIALSAPLDMASEAVDDFTDPFD